MVFFPVFLALSYQKKLSENKNVHFISTLKIMKVFVQFSADSQEMTSFSPFRHKLSLNVEN